jgi:uncharacterized membrane protein YbhN (UPF0104 family)
LKQCLHWAGSGLAIVGVVFVALRLREYSAEIDFERFHAVTWLAVASFGLVYGMANLMLALAWWNLLGYFGAHTSRHWAIKSYGIAQLAKYVPGNIFHLAGRQAIGMAAGIPAWPLVKSTVWELGLLSLAGTVFGLLALPWLLPALSEIWATTLFVVAVVVITLFLRNFLGAQTAHAFGWYAAFLVISGLLFVGLIALLTANENSRPWVALCGAYVLAWLAGLVTPGAPAGLGVRELVLLYLLKGFIGEADILLAVVLGRIVTVAGDLEFFGIATMMRGKASLSIG